ncbi:MAG: twin-arginine translocase subunit TatC, partial [Clostridia bacterium]|nr:twin-arginine translocase subunit TatC [Clostridia bacterium]
LAPGEVLWVYLKLTLIAGIVLASPVLLYQLGAFVWPGLTRRERRLAAVLLPGTVALFVAGGAFAYLVLLPLVLRFLVGLRPEGIASSLSVQSYVNFVVGLVVPVALVFEFPAAVALLTVIGLVTPAFLRHLRKYAILVIFIVAAAITPPDPFSQLIVAVPMLALYEVAVLLSAAVHHFQRRGVW